MNEAPKNNVESLAVWRERRDEAPSEVADEFAARLSRIENPTNEDKADALWSMIAEYEQDIQTYYYHAKAAAELLHPLVGNPVERYKDIITPTEAVAS